MPPTTAIPPFSGFRRFHRAIALLLFSAVLSPGCGKPVPSTGEPAPLPLAGVTLRLVVVDDPAIAAAVRQLRDEWNAQTGSKLEVRESTEKAVATAEVLPGDAVIGPSHLLGPWAQQELLAPVPKTFCREDKGPWSEIFDLLRLNEATWGGQTLAVPFGSPVLCCYYRADLLEKLGRRPPQTWAEYLELARLLDEKGSTAASRRYGTVEPLGPGWAGLVLLARAAPYAKHRDNYSALFDINSMEPLVAGPPFLRALEELVQAAKHGPSEQLGFDPAAARSAFWQGQCAMALAWPTGARQGLAAPGGTPLSVGFAELPGSTQVYNVGTRAWETRAEGSELCVPLLGVAGRIGVAGVRSEHVEAALQLLLWLSDAQCSPRVCAVSPATTLFRTSQVGSPQDWVEKPVDVSAAGAYAALTRQTLRRQQCLLAPRLPGRAEYLAALDEAVQSAVGGKQSPAEALQAAATRWRAITKRVGVDRQKAAYLQSLGLE